MEDLQGRRMLVVGGSSGIGSAILQTLDRADAELYNISRRKSEVKNVTNISLDVTADFTDIEGLPDTLNGLIYCPGSINLKPFQGFKPEDFRKDFELNFLGAVKVLQAVKKQIKASDTCSVVFFSTVAVALGMNYHTSIGAAKGALEGFMRSMAAEYAGTGVRFNAIAPSLTDTPMAKNLLSSAEKRRLSEERHPIKRVGSATEVAECVKYLVSDASAWVTGQVFRIDGGLSSVRPL